MQLQKYWEKYSSYKQFNISVLPEEIKAKGIRTKFLPGSVIISRGDFPSYIYFIESGIAVGTRDYNDGNNYYYFTTTNQTGSIGLLEILSHESESIATVVASTTVVALRVPSAIIYNYLMTHTEMLYNCIYVLAHDLYQRSGNDGILYYQSGLNRVRYYLVQYYLINFSGKEPLEIVPNYQTIAANIGVSVRTVGRSIQKLKEVGEISSVHKKLYVSPSQNQKMLKEIELLVTK